MDINRIEQDNPSLAKIYRQLNFASKLSMARKASYLRGSGRSIWVMATGAIVMVVLHTTIMVTEMRYADFIGQNTLFAFIIVCGCVSAIVGPLGQFLSNRMAPSHLADEWIGFRSYVERTLADVYRARVGGGNWFQLSMRAQTQLRAVCEHHEVPMPSDEELILGMRDECRDKYLICQEDDGLVDLNLAKYFEFRAIYQRTYLEGKIKGDFAEAERKHRRAQAGILFGMSILSSIPVIGMTLWLVLRVIADAMLKLFTDLQWQQNKALYKQKVKLINGHLAKVKEWQIEFLENLLAVSGKGDELALFLELHSDKDVFSDALLISFLRDHMPPGARFESSLQAHQEQQLTHLVQSIERILCSGHETWYSGLAELTEEEFNPTVIGG